MLDCHGDPLPGGEKRGRVRPACRDALSGLQIDVWQSAGKVAIRFLRSWPSTLRYIRAGSVIEAPGEIGGLTDADPRRRDDLGRSRAGAENRQWLTGWRHA